MKPADFVAPQIGQDLLNITLRGEQIDTLLDGAYT
jgi:hypothetical protein